MLLLELFELRIKHGSCNDTGGNIRNRHAVPHAFYSPKERKNQQAGNQNQYLSAQGKDDGFLGHADTLEEVGGHHLKTDDGEKQDDHLQSFCAQLYELCIRCKGRYGQFRHQFSHEEAAGRYNGGGDDGIFHDLVYPMVVLGTEIIAGNGLHPLVQSHHNHDK